MENNLGYLSFISNDVLVRSLRFLDHVSLCRFQFAHPDLVEWGRNQYVWQSLYNAERGGRSVLTPPTDWRCAFRQLRPAWDDPVLNPEGTLRWQGLAKEKDVPGSLGGQDPKLFDIGQGRLLILAGASYSERRAGIHLRQASDAYLVNLATTWVDAVPHWHPIRVEGAPPPALHGCYAGAFGDGVIADRLVTFAGGNHVDCHDFVSSLDLAQLPTSIEWQRLEPTPSPAPGERYAGASAVWNGCLVVLGGRDHGRFYGSDHIWLLEEPQTSSPTWQLMRTSGAGPSPRVWLAALNVGEHLIVYGGALWTFHDSCWGNDSPGAVWSCNMTTATWSCTRPEGPSPQCRVGAITSLCGKHLFVYGGCDLAQREYLNDCWLYDFGTATWTEVQAEESCIVEPRSHGVAVAIPQRHAVIVFGGARYLEGVYFRDFLCLKQVREEKPSDPMYIIGSLVEAHSLKTDALNGARGQVKGRQGERIQVDFGDPLGGKAIKPENLRLV